MKFRARALVPAGALAMLLAAYAAGQQPADPMAPPETPPPLPSPPRTGGEPLRSGSDVLADSDAPWGLAQPQLDQLARQAVVYRSYAVRFTCRETVRLADYDAGEASDETTRRYGYLLERDEDGETLREFRQRLDDRGQPKGGGVQDEDPFPPAYAWVFLFSEFNQPFFAYRDLGDRFEGFDWVREIQFRGALGFTDGRDIRQWEGTALVDAATFTPIEIHAQPARQDERILAQYRRWARSFNIIGFRTGPKPLAYRAHVQFRLRRDGLTFPTELRYDTLRAVSPSSSIRVRASTRVYDGYRFFRADTREEFETPDPDD